MLLTLDPAQYPLGIKGLITEKDPDVPVVWTNTNFKMLYMNMGHGDKIFTSPTQNKLFENGILWLLGKNNEWRGTDAPRRGELLPHREGTRRTTPPLSSGVERVKDPRSGAAFRGEAGFIAAGGTSTMYS